MDNQSNQNDKSANTAHDNMGYGTKAPETTLPETSTAKDTQTIINDAVKQVTVDDNGKYVYPADMDPVLKAAVAATKSYRDNQSGFTKSQQGLKESEAENVLLRERLAETTKVPLELTPERAKELDDLMYIDPTAWRLEMNKLEQQSSIAANEALDTVTKEARSKASGEFELERRVNYLNEYNGSREGMTDKDGNPLAPITADVLDNDVPKRINDKLAKGEITFEAYVDEVSQYLVKGKVVSQGNPAQTADLNKANGSREAHKTSQKEDELDYSSMTL